MTAAAFNRGKSKQDYQTPPDFMEAVRRRFGELDIDLAASSENKQANVYITEEIDSLSLTQHWPTGLQCWLNPPFSRIEPWARKCADSLSSRVLMLVPAAVGSNWFRDYVFHSGAAEVYFLNGRLKFVGAKDPYPKDLLLAQYIPDYRPFSARVSTWKWRTEE